MDGVDRICEHLDTVVAGYAAAAHRTPTEHEADALLLRIERGPEALVLRYGQRFEGTSWENRKGLGYRRRKHGDCFQNALDYSWKYGDLTYVEGFALSDVPMAVHHAWCATTDNPVVDPTWPDQSKGTAYLGIPFPSKLSAELALAEGGNHLVALMLGDAMRVRQLGELLRGSGNDHGLG
jgi:hypothetical protein